MRRNLRNQKQPHSGVSEQLAALTAQLVSDVLEAARRTTGVLEPSSERQKNGHRLRRLRTLHRAIGWQLELEAGQVRSRAEIARREAITRAAVTQIMRALDRVDGERPSNESGRAAASAEAVLGREGFRKRRKQVLHRFETAYVRATLRAAESNVAAAPRCAQIERKPYSRSLQRR